MAEGSRYNPNETYNPTQTALPSTGAPNDLLQVRASPRQMGVEVGTQLERAGQTGEELADKASQIAIQSQGLMNESWAQDAETKTNEAYGKIMGEYKSMEGPAAIAAAPQYMQKIAQVRQQLLGTAPNTAAGRAYNTLVQRSEGYTLRDIGEYSGGQVKATYLATATAAIKNAQELASNWGVASSDQQFNDQITRINHTAVGVLQAKGYGVDPITGVDPGTGMKIGPDGRPTFNDTPLGRQAQAFADNYINEQVGEAWYNRLNTLASDPNHKSSYEQAWNVYQQNKDRIPGTVAAKIEKEFKTPFRDEQAFGIVTDTASQLRTQYDQYLSGTLSGEGKQNISLGSLGQAFTDTEHSGANQTSAKGALGSRQIEPGTFRQYAVPGHTDFNNEQDRILASDKFIEHIWNLPQVAHDPARLAVGYFSGPTNVAPPGSPNPWKVDHTDGGVLVSQYVDKYLKNLADKSGSGYKSFPDFLADHQQEYHDAVVNQAKERYGDDPYMQDSIVRQSDSYVEHQIRQQNIQEYSYKNSIYQYLEQNPITNWNDLYKGPKEIQDAARWLQANRALDVVGMQKYMESNIRGAARTYGTDFSKLFSDVTSGQVKNPTDLASNINPVFKENSPLTNTGFNVLQKEFQLDSTPEGHAFAQAQSKFLDSVHKIITGGIDGNVDGEKRYSQWLEQALPRIQAGRADTKKNPLDMFDPSKKDSFVGNLLPAPSSDQQMKEQYEASRNTLRVQHEQDNSQIPDINYLGKYLNEGTISTPRALGWLYSQEQAGKLSRLDVEKFMLSHHIITLKPEVPNGAGQ